MGSSKNAIVETLAGKLEGQIEDDLYVFKGIPYAEPPIGELRWMPPEPCKPWRGVRPAHDFGAVSLQEVRYSEDLACQEPQSEDCLFLNIWTPALDDAKRPVMVWIHGGGFQAGSGSIPLYRGNLLAKRGNAVVVTINYRLGVLGFLNLYEITGGEIPASGNEGLLDQIMALKWVRDNIARFGGDPDNVTIFGESAGSMSVSLLLTLKQAQGLFQKAIMQSGSTNVVRSLESVVKMSELFLQTLGISKTGAEALRAVPSDRILSAQVEVAKKAGGVTPVEPLIDGRIIAGKPIEKIRAGSAYKIPVLCGTTLEETRMFLMMEPRAKDINESILKKLVGNIVTSRKADALIDSYRNIRSRRGMSTHPYDLLAAIQTDCMFRVPTLRLAEAQLLNKQNAYNYLFTWQSPLAGGSLGAYHSLDLGFVFGNLFSDVHGTGPAVERLSRNIQDAWTAFARTGNPSCESIGQWPRYDQKRNTMILGEKCYIAGAPYEEERVLWDNSEEISPALWLIKSEEIV
jgi:para-nitrobenzyl esterase